MKKKTRNILFGVLALEVLVLLVLIVVLVILPQINSVNQTDIVNFPDSELEVVIRNALEKPTGDIYGADLIGLTSLECIGYRIVNLEGIQHCVNLTNLTLMANGIVDISPLSDLTKLEKLYLNGNEIVDISPLSGLTNLTILDLDYNEIVDIQPLVDNAGLGAEDEVQLRHNNLYLTPVSLDMLNIEALERRGVRVYYDSQN